MDTALFPNRLGRYRRMPAGLLVVVLVVALCGEVNAFPGGGPIRPTEGDGTPNWFAEPCPRSEAERISVRFDRGELA